MFVIRARNVHQALPRALDMMFAPNNINSHRRDTRNGLVIAFNEPVTTVYETPRERVMFWEERDANPFFHLFESIWMLAGRNDVESVARFAANIRNYSDDGTTFHGAYGHRWRHHFGFDQLPMIIGALKADHNCRRQVLTMWDPVKDLGRTGKDLPCNLQAIFQVTNDRRLDMTVTNRSNDMIWGAYGANAVHFSYLHELVAFGVGVPVGVYRQVSANLHVYENTLEKVRPISEYAKDTPDPYEMGLVTPFPMVSYTVGRWLGEAEMFFDDPFAVGYHEPFFRRVAQPMLRAHLAFKELGNPHRFDVALEHLQDVKATDWQLAAREWLSTRLTNSLKAADNGVAYD